MPDYRFVNSKLMDCRHVERDDHYCGLIEANYIHSIPEGDDPNGELGHPYVAPPANETAQKGPHGRQVSN